MKGKERSRIRVVRIDNLKGILDKRREDKIPNVQIRELCGVEKRIE